MSAPTPWEPQPDPSNPREPTADQVGETPPPQGPAGPGGPGQMPEESRDPDPPAAGAQPPGGAWGAQQPPGGAWGAQQPPAGPWGEQQAWGGQQAPTGPWVPQPPYHAPSQFPPGVPAVGWYNLDPSDPLVTPPGAGFEGWYSRLTGTLRRSWRPLTIILGITQILPALVISLVYTWFTGNLASLQQTNSGYGETDPAMANAALGDLGVFLLVALVSSIILALLQSLGYAASTWAIMREATGQPASLGDAMRFGAGRMFGLWGWSLAVGLIVTLGACLCLLPGIYFMFALSLYGTVYLFERTDVLSRSWRLVHAGFGAVLGRMALLAVIVGGTQFIVSMLEGVVLGLLGIDPGLNPISAVLTAAGVLLGLPATVILVVGVLVTYTERRAAEAPVNSAGLAAELT